MLTGKQTHHREVCCIHLHGLAVTTLNTEAAHSARMVAIIYYRIFSNLIHTLFTVSEGQKFRRGLELRAD